MIGREDSLEFYDTEESSTAILLSFIAQWNVVGFLIMHPRFESHLLYSMQHVKNQGALEKIYPSARTSWQISIDM